MFLPVCSFNNVVAALGVGGLLAVGSNIVDTPNELFDEASGRWFELPHPMANPRKNMVAVALPAAVLAQQQAAVAARQAQIAALAAQARAIGPWSAEEKERFAEAAGWGS